MPQAVTAVPEQATEDTSAENSEHSGEIAEAELADGTTGARELSGDGEEAAAEPVVARRVGSPFAEAASGAGTADRPPPAKTHYVVTRPKYPRHMASVGGSIAALVLGILSLTASFYTSGAVITAVVGLFMGIWGLYSTRRGPAILGILLCCVAMAIGGFNGVVRVYEYHHGYKPWDVPSPYEPLDGSGMEDTESF